MLIAFHDITSSVCNIFGLHFNTEVLKSLSWYVDYSTNCFVQPIGGEEEN